MFLWFLIFWDRSYWIKIPVSHDESIPVSSIWFRQWTEDIHYKELQDVRHRDYYWLLFVTVFNFVFEATRPLRKNSTCVRSPRCQQCVSWRVSHVLRRSWFPTNVGRCDDYKIRSRDNYGANTLVVRQRMINLNERPRRIIINSKLLSPT